MEVLKPENRVDKMERLSYFSLDSFLIISLYFPIALEWGHKTPWVVFDQRFPQPVEVLTFTNDLFGRKVGRNS